MVRRIKRRTVLAVPRGGSLQLKVIVVLGLLMILLTCPPDGPAAARGSYVDLDYGQLSLSFMPNVGQTDSAVQFQMHDMGSTTFFTEDGVVLALPSKAQSSATVVQLRFLETESGVEVGGIDRLPGIVNYFMGNDPAGWWTSIPTYARLVYRQLYPGIDLHYDGASRTLKGTYVVAPGARPESIRWQHEGNRGVQIDSESGDLLIDLPGSTLIEHAPVAWQEIDGRRVSVSVSYALADDDSVTFEIGSYDQSMPLIIDPIISYSTFLGGSGFEEAEGIAVDGDGNAYVVGTTNSTNFPAGAPSDYGGREDVFVVKINAAGDTVLYSTYLGGGEDDSGNGIALDSAGNAYVTGGTDSTDFPTKNAFQDSCTSFMGVCVGDAFVAKLNADGNDLVYSTYLGGSWGDEAEGIAVDSAGSAYVVGTTFSSNFPTKNPVQASLKGSTDAFVAKLNAGGDDLLYSSYLGGNGNDFGSGIAVNGSSAYVAGTTSSYDFPTKNPVQATLAGSTDAFVVKMNADGSGMDYATYLGGSGKDYLYGAAVNSAGNAYVTGHTESTDFPTSDGAFDTSCGTDGNCNNDTGFYSYGDAFAAKLSVGGNALLYSTYLGGSDLDQGHAIVVDEAGSAYVTGVTHSADFPTEGPLQAYGGEADAFVVKLDAQGSSLADSTYLGGGSADYGTGIAVNDGNAYVTGMTFSNDFPTKSPLQATHGGGNADAFVVRLADEEGPPLPAAPNLQGSGKAASQAYLVSGETLTYTITLRNTGELAAIADVTDPLPPQMTYVDGSATGGGSYSAATRTLSWSGVEVGVGGETSLSFTVAAGTVTTPTLVTNVATIASGDDTLERSASVLLVPESLPGFDLRGSRKSASQYWVAAGERVTYTISLRNSGMVGATAVVTDVLPEELSYVSGSADAGGVYDSTTGTILWSDVHVPPGDTVALEFAMTAPTVVEGPSLVVNTAVITVGDESFERQAVVLLVAEPVEEDVTPPVVESLRIGEQDVLRDGEVTLHITATDDVGVAEMYVREWAWSGRVWQPWQVVQSSGWIPYEESYPWTLEPQSGVHFVGVWVADEAGNVSRLTKDGLDYASLLLAEETVEQRALVPYLVHYEAGEQVTAELETVSGDADLYVWFPGNLGLPDAYSINPDSELDEVSFTAPRAGTYLFVVYGHKASVYNFDISPGGGPRSWGAGASQAGAAAQEVSEGEVTDFAKLPPFDVGPIATVDPLAEAEPPQTASLSLRASYKMASQVSLVSGEALTYTIWLWNVGPTSATVDVTDRLPEEMSYVSGSVTDEGVYDAETQTVSWKDVEIDAGEVNALSFVVTATEVSAPKLVTNRAAIGAEGGSFERSVTVLLSPESSGLNLYGSQKTVSQQMAMPGDVLSYTIRLRNAGSVGTTAHVTDTLPEEMSYVSGSATDGGVYDAETRTVTWSGVEVSPGEEVPLSFAVMAEEVSAPVLVTNRATIAAEGESFERSVTVLLSPEFSILSLYGSQKTVSQQVAMPGDVMSYTIRLRNIGSMGTTAHVTDTLPEEMSYVSGSVTDGGVYDAETRTVSWSGVEVGPGEEVSLSFAVMAEEVSRPKPVINTATIAAEGGSFERRAGVLLVPGSAPLVNIRGSHKVASQLRVSAGDRLTYTIRLHNSGAFSVTADVMDVVPVEMDYVSGSAAGGGTYDPEARTLTWSEVTVPPGESISLSFVVTAAEVDDPTRVVNTATIAVGSESFERRAVVVLMPEPVEEDVTPPVVESLRIGEQDVLTDREVTLHISATDDVGVAEMYVREWAWSGRVWQPWQVVQSSGWIPYEESYPWMLEPQSGVHFVAVWVADEAGNVSRLTKDGLDYASLVLVEETVEQGALVPYLVHYEAGEQVTAELETVSGDADLYVWFPGNLGLPDAYSINPDTELDEVSFTASRAGTYLFVVYGHKASVYNFDISPGGGPQAWAAAADQAAGFDPDWLAWIYGGTTGTKGSRFYTEPLLSSGGVDPLSEAEAPEWSFVVYLPLVVR